MIVLFVGFGLIACAGLCGLRCVLFCRVVWVLLWICLCLIDCLGLFDLVDLILIWFDGSFDALFLCLWCGLVGLKLRLVLVGCC